MEIIFQESANYSKQDSKFSKDLEAIFYFYDLVELASLGCPKDEYAPEARALASELTSEFKLELSSREIADISYEVFSSFFCKETIPAKDDPVYLEMASDVQKIREKYISD